MVIVSSSSASSSTAAALSMSIGFGSMPSWHVGIALIPLDSVKLWMLSDGPVCWSAFYALLPKHVGDEERER